MAKKDESGAQNVSPAALENEKLHGDASAESREVESHELTPGVQPRHVSDEELKAIEEANKEPNLAPEDLDESDKGKATQAASVPAAAASPDSADYHYRDVLGTSIVGYQEQVPNE